MRGSGGVTILKSILGTGVRRGVINTVEIYDFSGFVPVGEFDVLGLLFDGDRGDFVVITFAFTGTSVEKYISVLVYFGSDDVFLGGFGLARS